MNGIKAKPNQPNLPMTDEEKLLPDSDGVIEAEDIYGKTTYQDIISNLANQGIHPYSTVSILVLTEFLNFLEMSLNL